MTFEAFSRREYVFLILMLTGLSAALALFYRKRSANRSEAFSLFIFLNALIIHVFYIIYTPTWQRQHDVIGFGNEKGIGQAALIEYLLNEGKLPDFDPTTRWGFFQPMLHHITAALFLRLNLLRGINYFRACESIQILTLLYSMVFIFYGFRILRIMGLKGPGLHISEALLSLHPILTLLSGSVNNDMMSHMFLIMAVFYALKWQKNDSLKDLLLTALFIGLSMMAKLSGVLAAPAVAFLMLYKLIADHKEGRDLFRRFGQYVLFGVISLPIGLFFPLRNMILFRVPLMYMPEVGEDLSGYSIISRIFDIRTDTPYACMIKNGNAYDEFNVFLMMIKTGLTGEYDYGAVHGIITPFAWILFLTGSALFIADICLFIMFLKGSFIKEVPIRLFWGILIFTGVFFMGRLMFTVPNFSSGDLRYIAWIVLPAAMLPGLFVSREKRIGTGLLTAGTVLFVLPSLAVYYLLGLP